MVEKINFKKFIKKKEKMIYLVLYLKASSGFLLPTRLNPTSYQGKLQALPH